MADQSPKPKFTLVELLVVIAFVAVPVGLLLPSISKVPPAVPVAVTPTTAKD